MILLSEHSWIQGPLQELEVQLEVLSCALARLLEPIIPFALNFYLKLFSVVVLFAVEARKFELEVQNSS